MTAPLEVVVVEIVSDTDNFTPSKDVDHELNTIKKSVSSTLSAVNADLSRAAGNMAEVFRDANGRLRDTRGRFVAMGKAGTEAFTGVTQTGVEFLEVIREAFQELGSFIGRFSKFASNPIGIALAVSAFGLLAEAAAVAAVQVQNLITVGTFLGALLPGAILGAVSAFGILRVALGGVLAAYKEQTKTATRAGTAGVNNARQVADAQRGILQAAKDLDKAREEELKRIRQITIDLQRARATEARAADDVLKAEYALQRAREVGTPRAQIEAQLALDEANASLTEAEQKTKDLSAEKAKADKNGVNGSDQVLRAQEALLDAQDRLAATQQRINTGLADTNKEFNALSPNAQKFVLALVEARKELQPLKTAIQDAFFSGSAPLIQPIVDNLLELQPEIVRVSSAFGDLFKDLLRFLGSEEAREGFSRLLSGMSSFLKEIRPAIGPLVSAFVSLAGASGDLGGELGVIVREQLVKLAEFVRTVDLRQLFVDAKKAVRELYPFLRDLFFILRSVFNIFATAGRVILPPVLLLLRGLSIALDGLASVFEVVGGIITSVFGPAFDVAFSSAARLINFIKGVPAQIAALYSKMAEAGKNFFLAFFESVSSGKFITDFAKRIGNAVIDAINGSVIDGINKGLKAVSDTLHDKLGIFAPNIPLIPKIPRLAKGGVSTQNTLAEISEGNREEAVIPLSDPRAMRKIANAITRAGGVSESGGGIVFGEGAVMVTFAGALPTTEQARTVGRTVGAGIIEEIRRRQLRAELRRI